MERGERLTGQQLGAESLRHALVDLLLRRKLLDPKEVVGASGFEPPSSWSRTSLDQAKSVELTAFACAFPPAYLGYVGYKVPMA